MKSESVVVMFLLAVIGLLLANMMGWLPQPGGGGQVVVVTAVPAPQLVPVDTAVPVETWAGAAPTAVPDLVIISPPATWTAPSEATPPATPTQTGPRLMQGCSVSRGTCPGQGTP